MTFDSHHIRQGHTSGLHKIHYKRDPDSSCTTGGFYKSPTAGQAITSGSSLNIAWDTTCLNTDAVDIYLYAPSAGSSRIHLWQNVNYALGTYADTLSASWWNSTGSVDLQLTIVPSGTPPFLATLPAAPVWTATIGSGDKSAGTTVSSNDAVQDVNNFTTAHHTSKGKIAAAVIIPLLIVGGLLVVAWLKFTRTKTQEKTKRFSQAIDKRMSTISTDWKSISPAGASAAIRNSVAVNNNRASSFSFGNIRPTSTMAVEGDAAGHAGVGASRGMYLHENGSWAPSEFGEKTYPEMSQLRSGPRLNPVTGEPLPRVSFAAADSRVSRVSFAPDTRPSMESGRAVSRAYSPNEIPPVPPKPILAKDEPDMSPTQTSGPLTLTAEDIESRMAHQDQPRPSVDDYMPALSMMRHNGQEEHLLFTPVEPVMPTPPTPAASKPIASPSEMLPDSMMSPDAMLRAYAERRRTQGGATPVSAGTPAFPAPAMYDGNGMRALYSPPPVLPAQNFAPIVAESNNPYRKSMASEFSKYDDEDAYGGI